MKIGNARIIGSAKANLWQRVGSSIISDAEGTDQFDRLLVHFNGSDGSTSDYTAETGQTVSLEGNAQLDDAQKKFGATSLLLDGSGDYATVPDSNYWSFGTSNFTIDLWVRFASTTGNQYFICQLADGNNMWSLGAPSGKLEFYSIIGGVEKAWYDMTWNPTVDTWYHICFVRSGTGAKLFIDGVSQTLTEHTAFSTNDLGNVSAPLYIGSSSASTGFFNGWIDEVRVSNGIARRSTNFTPPTEEYGITSITFSGLDGNVAEEYILRARGVGGANSSVYLITFNGDSGSNYGRQYLTGNGSNATALQASGDTRMQMGNSVHAAGDIIILDMHIYAKSGNARLAVSKFVTATNGTTVGPVYYSDHIWSNTADNLTSITISAYATNGHGAGTIIDLYAKRTST